MYDLQELSTRQKVELELILKAGYEPEEARSIAIYLLGSENNVSKDCDSNPDIKGCFGMALRNLIANIKNENIERSLLLYKWDRDRGTDWYTSTKLSESK